MVSCHATAITGLVLVRFSGCSLLTMNGLETLINESSGIAENTYPMKGDGICFSALRIGGTKRTVSMSTKV